MGVDTPIVLNKGVQERSRSKSRCPVTLFYVQFSKFELEPGIHKYTVRCYSFDKIRDSRSIVDRSKTSIYVWIFFLAVEDEASELVEETTKQISKPNSCVEKSINEESGVSFSAVLWSECFKPRNSTEILGNTNAGGKLRNWLFEWKTLREKKLEALKRHEEKKYRR